MSSTPIQHDVMKLPKWAQDRIRQLQKTNDKLVKERQMMATGETNVAILDYTNDNIPLPPDSNIVFSLNDSNHSIFTVGIEESSGRRFLNVRSMGQRSLPIAISPRGAANVIEIFTRE